MPVDDDEKVEFVDAELATLDVVVSIALGDVESELLDESAIVVSIALGDVGSELIDEIAIVELLLFVAVVDVDTVDELLTVAAAVLGIMAVGAATLFGSWPSAQRATVKFAKRGADSPRASCAAVTTSSSTKSCGAAASRATRARASRALKLRVHITRLSAADSTNDQSCANGRRLASSASRSWCTKTRMSGSPPGRTAAHWHCAW